VCTEIEGTVVECTKGDITCQSDCEAVVNAANAELRPGGGVAGAIHQAAGPALYQECRSMAPIRTGDAVITGAHGLPNRYIIHVLGPVYNLSEDPALELDRAYQNALYIAEDHRVSSVAFPALSTGAFGYPMPEAAEVAIGTVQRTAPDLRSVRLIRFVLYDEEAERLHREVLKEQSG